MKFTRLFATKVMAKGVLISLVSVSGIAFALIYLNAKHTAFAEKVMGETMQTDAHTLDLFLESEKARTRVAANSMAINQNAINAIQRRDGAEIPRVFQAALSLYPIDFFVVCDGNGTIMARTIPPNAPGTSLLDVQGVRDALYGKPSTYFEADRLSKVSIITSVPIYGANGAVIAVVLGGAVMDSDRAIANARDMLKADGTLFVGNTIAAQLPSDEYTGPMAMALFAETTEPITGKDSE
jgi:hypothetical protein